MDPRHLGSEALQFMSERHLATLTTLRADGSPHVVPVGFTYDPERHVARVITFAAAVKARHAASGRRAAVSQVDRARWITLEGHARLSNDPAEVAAAVSAYAARYRQPKVRPDRVVIDIDVQRVMCSQTWRAAV